MKCDAGVCVDWDDDDFYDFLWGSLAQVDHPIAGGEGTGTPQEALPELSVELVTDGGLAQIEFDSPWNTPDDRVYKNEGESCTKPNERCTLYTSCVNGVCCDDWLGCMGLAQVDQPIAGGEGTGTPQEALTELSVEFPLFDNELAQVEADAQHGFTHEDTLCYLYPEHCGLAQIKAEAHTNANWNRGHNEQQSTCDFSFACMFQRKCKPCPDTQ